MGAAEERNVPPPPPPPPAPPPPPPSNFLERGAGEKLAGPSRFSGRRTGGGLPRTPNSRALGRRALPSSWRVRFFPGAGREGGEREGGGGFGELGGKVG